MRHSLATLELAYVKAGYDITQTLLCRSNHFADPARRRIMAFCLLCEAVEAAEISERRFLC
jgi:hypothetical protein